MAGYLTALQIFLAAMATPLAAGAASFTAFSAAPIGAPPPPWQLVTLPKVPRHTRFAIVERDKEHVLRVEADGSYGNLMHRFAGDAAPDSSTPILLWRWRVDAMSMQTDITRKSGDDVPGRVCVLFDLRLERLSPEDNFLVSVGRKALDPDLPAATICCVWDAHVAVGTWLPNAYTARVMQLVLERGLKKTWKEERRDLRLDFAAAFPHESANGPFPRIAAIGVSADGDNTGARSLAFFGDITLRAE